MSPSHKSNAHKQLKYDYVVDALRIMEQFDFHARPVVMDKLTTLSEEQHASAAALYICCDSTSKSICELAKIRRIWDMQILIRTVINASAKFCFLLYPNEQIRAARFKKYIELTSKGDYASLEKPLNALFTMGSFGTSDELCFAIREIKTRLLALKTQEGESQIVKDAKIDFDYWRMSKKLENEFWYWKKMGPKFDFEYAIANRIVHLNYTGCGDVMRRISGLLDGSHTYADDDAIICHMLLILCSLYKARCESAFKVIGEDPMKIRNVLTKAKPFVQYANETGIKARQRLLQNESDVVGA